MEFESLRLELDGVKADLILQRLEACGWSMRGAARSLGLPHTTLYSMMHRLGVMDEYRSHQPPKESPNESEDST